VFFSADAFFSSGSCSAFFLRIIVVVARVDYVAEATMQRPCIVLQNTPSPTNNKITYAPTKQKPCHKNLAMVSEDGAAERVRSV
jgi:hypothetical protein